MPKCYGWLELSVDDMDSVASLPGISIRLQFLKNDKKPPKALLLEFLEDAQQLSVKTITPQIADAALRSLYHVHASYILHGDMHDRNILVLPTGRVVWVDFDTCIVGGMSSEGIPAIARQDLFDELARAWKIFYKEMVSECPSSGVGWYLLTVHTVTHQTDWPLRVVARLWYRPICSALALLSVIVMQHIHVP